MNFFIDIQQKQKVLKVITNVSTHIPEIRVRVRVLGCFRDNFKGSGPKI